MINQPGSVIYHGWRDADGRLVVTVEGDKDRHPYSLFHMELHSPTGFECGYGGSGPADLARSILAHRLGGVAPPGGIYQAFKFAVVAGLAREGWTLRAAQVQKALDIIAIDRGIVCLVCGDSGWLWKEQTPEREERPCACPRGFEELAELGLDASQNKMTSR